jgi:hypothetical protein
MPGQDGLDVGQSKIVAAEPQGGEVTAKDFEIRGVIHVVPKWQEGDAHTCVGETKCSLA